MNGIRLFNPRLVNEIKDKSTSAPYEKSRLATQACNDDGKSEVLTQSLIIQRMSQHPNLAIAPSLYDKCKLYIRDITQSYVQSGSGLNCPILAKPPIEQPDSLSPNTVLQVVKQLYRIPEAAMH